MAKKPNPLLTKYEAVLEKRHRQELARSLEIDTIALLIAANDCLNVGPGRADKLLNDFLACRTEIAENLLSDYDADKELVYTKHDLTARLKSILGPDSWKNRRVLFPLCKMFWDD